MDEWTQIEGYLESILIAFLNDISCLSEIKDPKSWDTPSDDPCVWTLGASNSIEIIEKSSKLSMVQPEVFPKKQTQVFNSFYLFVCLTLLDDKSTGSKKLTTEKTSLTSPPIGVLAAASNQIKQLVAI